MEITVVVPAGPHAHWPALVRAVASARAQTHRPVEVVVVVDHDTAYFRRVRRDLPVTVLENEYARGLPGCRAQDAASRDTTPRTRSVTSGSQDAAHARDGDWAAAGIVVRRAAFREVGGFARRGARAQRRPRAAGRRGALAGMAAAGVGAMARR